MHTKEGLSKGCMTYSQLFPAEPTQLSDLHSSTQATSMGNQLASEKHTFFSVFLPIHRFPPHHISVDLCEVTVCILTTTSITCQSRNSRFGWLEFTVFLWLIGAPGKMASRRSRDRMAFDPECTARKLWQFVVVVVAAVTTLWRSWRMSGWDDHVVRDMFMSVFVRPAWSRLVVAWSCRSGPCHSSFTMPHRSPVWPSGWGQAARPSAATGVTSTPWRRCVLHSWLYEAWTFFWRLLETRASCLVQGSSQDVSSIWQVGWPIFKVSAHIWLH